MYWSRWLGIFILALGFCVSNACTSSARPQKSNDKNLKILFLGDNAGHVPKMRFRDLQPALAKRGIQLTYTDQVNSLQKDILNKYDGLLIYANIEKISPQQMKALSEYVASGKGFIPVHCASFCFLNSEDYVQLVGAQFQRHGAETFSTVIAEPDHPIMKGFSGFTSWDETYVHHRHNEKDRTVLEYRETGAQARGKTKEPWTWVRTHGDGRVFYTAWGHDQRTWTNPGFVNLMERGIRWACGDDPSRAPAFSQRKPFVTPATTAARKDVKPFEFEDVGPKIPNYTPGQQWGKQGKAYTLMQKPLSPEESLKHYRTPVDFSMKLFVSDPALEGNPIAMNWDERGRLWVCETLDYPNKLQRGNKGRDRIRICEDTDNDGKADKFTVFAEDLSIPSTLIFYRGGAIVQNGSETLYLKDTDGDDKADVRTVLLRGWGMSDTHGGVSNFHYGFDNWIWGSQGYNYSVPTTPEGKRFSPFRMGFFRFKLDNSDPPKVTDVEFLRSAYGNTWGLGFSEEGLVFGSSANRYPSLFMPIPNRYYERVRGWSPSLLASAIADNHYFDPVTKKVRQVDQHGGYTAAAGHALYTARAYPQNWWNRTAFVCGPTGHLVGTFVLNPQGADFRSNSPCNLVASDDEWAAPIMAEVGPDGNVWVIDWYAYIVQHNPTPSGFKTGKGNAYETDLRNEKLGRIYRLVYDKNPESLTPNVPQLNIANPKMLVASLKHPTMLVRKHAQRLLVERGKTDVVPDLLQLINNTELDSIGLNVGAIHALWTLQGLNAIRNDNNEIKKAVVNALSHPCPGVRRTAAMVLPNDASSSEILLTSDLFADPEAQVRLAAVLACADLPAQKSIGEFIAKRISTGVDANDRWISEAMVSAAAAHALPFLQSFPAQSRGKESPNGKALAVVEIIGEHFGRGSPDAEATTQLLNTLRTANADYANAVLTGLAKGWPKDHTVKLDQEVDKQLSTLFDNLSVGGKVQLMQLASRWGSTTLEKYAAKIGENLLETINDSSKSDRARIDAARQLIQFRANSNEAVEQLLACLLPKETPAFVKGMIGTLAESQADDLGNLLLAKVPTLTPAGRDEAFQVLLQRPKTTMEFLQTVQAGKVSLNDLPLTQQQALSNHPDRRIRSLASKLLSAGGSLPNPDREKVLQQLLPLTKKTGDIAIGKVLFKKHCANCHVHGNEGGKIGPELTGMAVHPKEELLMHIIDPSRSVESNFRTYTVITNSGKIINGMMTAESKTSIEIVDAEAKRQAIQREDIEELVSSRKSLMPEGFEKQMSEKELTDLLEFLTDKGKYLPIPLAKYATAVSTKGLFHDGDDGPDRLIFDNWKGQVFKGVPFALTDPQGKSNPNIILMYGPQGTKPPRMPKSVTIPCNTKVKAIHLLSGVSGWGFPYQRQKSTSLLVRFHYADGTKEDHKLLNGVHFADYIRKVDVPESTFAFNLRGQQIRYLSVESESDKIVQDIEFLSGFDSSSAIIMAVTLEIPEK